jgi:NADH-quinone oxidoreductase subunit J
VVQRVAAAVIGAGTTALFASVLLPALGGQVRPIIPGATPGIATQLFSSWVWPFELLSLLLLVALIAALAVSRMPKMPLASTASKTAVTALPEKETVSVGSDSA